MLCQVKSGSARRCTEGALHEGIPVRDGIGKITLGLLDEAALEIIGAFDEFNLPLILSREATVHVAICIALRSEADFLEGVAFKVLVVHVARGVKCFVNIKGHVFLFLVFFVATGHVTANRKDVFLEVVKGHRAFHPVACRTTGSHVVAKVSLGVVHPINPGSLLPNNYFALRITPPRKGLTGFQFPL
jgi:hypothetical protein